MILFLAAAAMAASGWAATTRPKPAPAVSKPADHILVQNPLLPPQVEATALIPEIPLIQKTPASTPAGFETIYTDWDWAAYREKFGAEADTLGGKKASAQLEFAQRMLEAAGTLRGHDSLVRLVMLRVVAIAYRNKDGAATVSAAMDRYQQVMDKNVPTHVAGLWQMADVVGRYSATPREARPAYSLLAAKANVQLAMLLLDGGQVSAANGMIKMLGRHEASLKLDPAFKVQAANARAIVVQTAALMNEVAVQAMDFDKGDAASTMRLYLYAKFAARPPYPQTGALMPDEIVRRIVDREPASAAAALDATLNKARGEVTAAFDAGEMLRSAAESLPDGILKHRVLHAARDEYAAFVHAPETDSQRVNRTRATIAMQQVVSDGAAGPPHIRPLEPPAATQPATRPAR